MNNSFQIITTIIVVILVIAMWYMYSSNRKSEYFTNITSSIDEEIIQTYQYLLQRDPTMDEMKSIREDMKKKGLNFYTLRQLLIDSDEYQRIIKVQSNDVSPELLKMIADREQLNRINEIYNDTLKRKIKSELVIPYHDLYVHVFKNNDQLLRNMLLDKRYGTFEYELLHTVALNRDKLFALYDRIYEIEDINVPSWWPSVPLKEEVDKNKFKTFEGKDVWYPSLPSEKPPKSNYIVSPTSSENAAGYWQSNYEKLDRGMASPWKGIEQEEVSYTSYTPSGMIPIVRQPIQTTAPLYPSRIPPAPVSVPGYIPQPNPPLQSGPVFSSLGTSPLTITPSVPPVPLDPTMSPTTVSPEVLYTEVVTPIRSEPSMITEMKYPELPLLQPPVFQVGETVLPSQSMSSGPAEFGSSILPPSVPEKVVLPPHAQEVLEVVRERQEEKRAEQEEKRSENVQQQEEKREEQEDKRPEKIEQKQEEKRSEQEDKRLEKVDQKQEEKRSEQEDKRLEKVDQKQEEKEEKEDKRREKVEQNEYQKLTKQQESHQESRQEPNLQKQQLKEEPTVVPSSVESASSLLSAYGVSYINNVLPIENKEKEKSKPIFSVSPSPPPPPPPPPPLINLASLSSSSSKNKK